MLLLISFSKLKLLLKHKKYDLLAENLPLAFDLLDKSSVQTCPHPLCFHASVSNPACVQCKMIPAGSTGRKQSKCVCKTQSAGVKNEPSVVGQHQHQQVASINPKNAADLLLAQKKPSNSITNSALNPTLTSLLKQSDSQASSSYNVISTRFDEPFHRRACYFNHTRPAKSKMRASANLNLVMSKTIQFKNNASSFNKEQVFEHSLLAVLLLLFFLNKSSFVTIFYFLFCFFSKVYYQVQSGANKK